MRRLRPRKPIREETPMHKYAALTALAIALNVTMLTLAGSASVTPANARGASVSAPYCRLGAMVSVRARTPCVFGTGPDLRWSFAASYQNVTGWKGMVLYSAEIIEPPHNGTAVLGADGRIYYSPRPGFTGRDFMRVQRAACNYSGTWHADPSHDWCGDLARTYSIFVE
jgi:hypothetical protein